MKTTIDLPEEVLHRAKVVAAQRKTTLKELVIQGLDYATRTDAGQEDRQRRNKAAHLLAALRRVGITEPVGVFNRDDVYDRQAGKWEP